MNCTGAKAGSILIIDDDRLCCEILKTSIESHTDYSVQTCDSLVALGSVGRLSDFDLIILDYELEQMNGVEIAQYIDAFFPEKPAIVITGRSFVPVPDNRLPRSIRIFVSKSIGTDGIVEIVRHLKLRRREDLPTLPEHFYS
jgi:DNA-binding NtrC family response regulator